MNQLPTEILGLILKWDVSMCRIDKNSILPLRLVCKAFDIALRPFILKTIKLEYSCFLRDSTIDVRTLERVGNMCDSIYLDMMVIRDEEEMSRLTEIFQGLISKVPELVPTLNNLRRYCMSEDTFDEMDFRRVTENTLAALPNVRRFKMILPYQIVGGQSSPSTILLATTLACLAKRNEEHAKLDTLVIDHVSDTTVNNICNNPIDLSNAMDVFEGLNSLILSIKRQECRSHQFNKNIWFLIRKATNLLSLCLIGWNTKRDITTRRHEREHRVDLADWRMRSLPYPLAHTAKIKTLRFLELKRVDILPHELVALIKDCTPTLNELYLVEVYLKVNGELDQGNISLWIGHPNAEKQSSACWVAQSLQEMKSLNLSILRATGLGYDDFEPDSTATNTDYDLKDPTGLNKSFDQRFVEAVMHPEIKVIVPPLATESESSLYGDIADDPIAEDILNGMVAFPPADYDIAPQSSITFPPLQSPTVVYNISTAAALTPNTIVTNNPSMSQPQPTNCHPEPQPDNDSHPRHTLRPIDYDAEIFQRYHNTTSLYKRSIDGYFFNHREHALRELQNLINVADRGMDLINDEIRGYRQAQVNAATGGLDTASAGVGVGVYVPFVPPVVGAGTT